MKLQMNSISMKIKSVVLQMSKWYLMIILIGKIHLHNRILS